jgi:hypothetical protein
MNLSPKLADQIAKRYDESKDWTGASPLDRALAEVIRRHGGLCAALNEDARRDLILTLGDRRRATNSVRARVLEKFSAMRGEPALKHAAE